MANPSYSQVALETSLPIYRELKALLPSESALENVLRSDSLTALRRAKAGDQEALTRSGFGKTVGRAFSGGTRDLQFARALARAIAGARGDRANTEVGLLGSALNSPATQTALQDAYTKAHTPSPLAKFFGGALNLAGGALLPGLIGGQDPLRQLLMQMLAPQSSGEQSFAGTTANLQFPNLKLPTGTF